MHFPVNMGVAARMKRKLFRLDLPRPVTYFYEAYFSLPLDNFYGGNATHMRVNFAIGATRKGGRKKEASSFVLC